MPIEQITVLNAVSAELNEKKRREKNIAISGLAESSSTDAEKKKADETAQVTQLFEAIGNPGVAITHLYRMKPRTQAQSENDRSQSKPGIVIVSLESTTARDQVMQNAKKLRENPTYNNVYLNKDYTKAESAQNYSLRIERNKRNALLTNNSPKIWAIADERLVEVNRRMPIAQN